MRKALLLVLFIVSCTSCLSLWDLAFDLLDGPQRVYWSIKNTTDSTCELEDRCT